ITPRAKSSRFTPHLPGSSSRARVSVAARRRTHKNGRTPTVPGNPALTVQIPGRYIGASTDGMGRTFTPLRPLRPWRRVAVHPWHRPQDPSVYALIEVPMRGSLAYLERIREETGVRVTVTHLVIRALALAIRRYPTLNGIVARGQVFLRDSVDIF